MQTGDTICLPGSELAGCPNVASFNNNPKCKYYSLQPGESIATIAVGLNLYQPDIEAANPDIIQRKLQVGDLIKLPPWDTAKCGVLPTNIQQLVVAASPPPLSMPTTPPKPTGSKPKSPSPSPIPQNSPPTTFQAPPAQADAQKCRGFRARESDDLFSIASLFVIDVSQLVTVNPDLAGGIPIVTGMVVKIPPFDPTCSTPVLVDAESLLASPPLPSMNGPQVGSRPVNGGAPTADGPAASTQAGKDAQNTPPTQGGDWMPSPTTDSSYEDRTTSSSGPPDFGLGGADTIEASETYQQNIVKDGGNSNAPPPPQSGSNTGNIIMGVTIFVVCIAVIGILGMAFSGTGAMKLSMKKDAAPEIGYVV